LAFPAGAHPGTPAELKALGARILEEPRNRELRLERARLERRRGHLAAAIRDLRVVQAQAPGHWQLLLEQGLVSRARGKLKQADAELTRSLAARVSVEALVARAQVREATDKLELARQDYDRALRLKPSPELYLARGRIDESQGDLDRAAAGYAEGLDKLGGALVVRLALIRVERARKRYQRAIELLNPLFRQAGFDADWLLLRGEIHEQAGQLDRAREDRRQALAKLHAAIAKRPTALRLVARARARLALQDASGAIADLDRALGMAPRLTEARELRLEAKRRAQEGN
jgi:tetratricopeptide (TPR) repeat protein